MKFSAERETILAPLQAVIGVVERRQTMPILANVLVVGRGEHLSITATDLEVELVARTNVSLQQAGEVTLPGRKFLDIVRALPEKTQVTVSIEGENLRQVTWVVIEEVQSGDWGIGGNSLTTSDVLRLAAEKRRETSS